MLFQLIFIEKSEAGTMPILSFNQVLKFIFIVILLFKRNTEKRKEVSSGWLFEEE